MLEEAFGLDRRELENTEAPSVHTAKFCRRNWKQTSNIRTTNWLRRYGVLGYSRKPQRDGNLLQWVLMEKHVLVGVWQVHQHWSTGIQKEIHMLVSHTTISQALSPFPYNGCSNSSQREQKWKCGCPGTEKGSSTTPEDFSVEFQLWELTHKGPIVRTVWAIQSTRINVDWTTWYCSSSNASSDLKTQTKIPLEWKYCDMEGGGQLLHESFVLYRRLLNSSMVSCITLPQCQPRFVSLWLLMHHSGSGLI